ncbi:MAG TPA: hypothetical protein V6C72_09200, partial [Chroococcales cyanobacterium]
MPEKLLKIGPWLLIIVGCLLIFSHIAFNLGTWSRSTILKATHQVSYPQSYKFETYDKLLHQFVKGKLVDYTGLKKSPLLNQAVAELEKVSPDSLPTDNDKICYWINAYN